MLPKRSHANVSTHSSTISMCWLSVIIRAHDKTMRHNHRYHHIPCCETGGLEILSPTGGHDVNWYTLYISIPGLRWRVAPVPARRASRPDPVVLEEQRCGGRVKRFSQWTGRRAQSTHALSSAAKRADCWSTRREADDHATRTRREICGHKRSPDGTRASRHRRTCPVTTRGSRAHWNNQARSGDEKCKNLRGCTLHRRCSLHTTPRMCTPAIVQTAMERRPVTSHQKSRTAICCPFGVI